MTKHAVSNLEGLRSIYLATQSDTKLVTEYDSSIKAFRSSNADRDIVWAEDPDVSDCIVLFEEWRTQFWTHADTLTADPFFSKYWQKILTVNCDDHGRGFIPGCYTGLTRTNIDRRIHRACAHPYTYNQLVHVEQRREWSDTKWLFSFRGNLNTRPVRRRLLELFGDAAYANVVHVGTKWHTHSDEEKGAYIGDILDSKFVLCPGGLGPGSYRTAEVMALGRCPVIISDDWVPVEGVDWANCAIFVNERDVARLPELLRSREANAESLGVRAREEWIKNFSESGKFRQIFDSIAAIHSNLRRNPFDYRLRWKTWSFYRSNGWLLYQRVASRIARLTR